MSAKSNIQDRLGSLEKRRVDVEPEQPKVERKSYRLNTNMDLELQKKLDMRRALGYGTKTDQLDISSNSEMRRTL